MSSKFHKTTKFSADDPAALRGIFGANLRRLSEIYPSVAGLCRELGINRTQFNRYLSGESFPRPDVLYQICSFFDVDARILLEPVEDLRTGKAELLGHPFLDGYFGAGPSHVPDTLFPSGFCGFVRRSFIDDAQFTTGLVMRQEEGVMALVSHRASLAASFNFLTPETSFQSTIWEGYATRTLREKVSGRRAARMVYEYLGTNISLALRVARDAGLVPLERVPPFHARLLRLDEPFR